MDVCRVCGADDPVTEGEILAAIGRLYRPGVLPRSTMIEIRALSDQYVRLTEGTTTTITYDDQEARVDDSQYQAASP